MQDERFEWDDEKAAANFKKHHITFEQASAVFDDPLAIERPDRDQEDEDRYIITGKVTGLAGDKLVTVVYTERNGRIRIISARKATRREQDTYYQQAR
jgi:uncharacterized DUF497 family protein